MRTKIIILIALIFISGNVLAQIDTDGDATISGSLTIGDNLVADKSLTILAPDNVISTNSIVFDYGIKQASINAYSHPSISNPTMYFTIRNRSGIDYTPVILRYNNADFYGLSFESAQSSGATLPFIGSKLVFKAGDLASINPYFQKVDSAEFKSDLFLYLRDTNDFKIVGISGDNPFFKVSQDPQSSTRCKVGILTNDPEHELDVNGTIRAKEVVVETDWADFVFDKDYKLLSLDNVKAHINEYKHLPGIPSGTEVKENGVGLADMTTKLLQKVEELTLYAIQQQETIEKLNKRIKDIEAKK